MAMKQGMPNANVAGDKLEKHFDSMRDQPAVPMNEIPPGSGSRADRDQNARGVPGYYYNTSTADDQRMKYRVAAANDGKFPKNVARDLNLNVSDIERDPAAHELLRGFKVDLTEKDVDFLEKRRRAAEQVAFDDWLTQVVDITDPAQNRWLQQMYPEFWARREKFIEDKINIEAKLAKVRLRGPKDISDFKLIYAIDQGYVSPAEKPLWIGTPAGGNSFRTGWLSLYRSTRKRRNQDEKVTEGRAEQGSYFNRMMADGGISGWQ